MTDTPSEIIPLFPLNVVLFPQSQLHLHIFEERYRTLIAECISYDHVFGINFLHDHDISPVGCTAAVKNVEKRYDDGRLDIVVEGRRRYHLHNLVEAPHPYYSGRVTWLQDAEEEVDDALRRIAVDLHNRFVQVVFPGIVKPVPADDVRKSRAFHLVQKAGLELEQRQSLLAMTSENARLTIIVRHLEAVLPLLSSKRTVEVLAQNDGYIQE